MRNMGRGLTLATALVAGLVQALPGSAGAQTATPETTPQTVTQQQQEAAKAAAEARALQEGTGPAVTFDQVMRDPDNIDLNFRFARQKVQEGDLRGAATSLERILLVAPTLSQVRLLYAIVLFRLDNLQESEREFRTVLEQPVSPAVKAEVDGYLGQISQRQKVTRFTASLGVGVDYNSNRDAVPRNEKRLFADTELGTSGGGEDDFGRILLGTVGVRHDLGMQERHELIANATVYYNNQVEVDAQDLRAISLDAGAVLRSPQVDLTPTVTHTRIQLNNEAFLASTGLKLLGEKKLSGKLDVYGSVWAQHQDFQRTFASPTASDRSGPRYDFDVGASYILTPTQRVGINFEHTLKRASVEFQNYKGNEITGSHTWLLGQGQFLLSSASFGNDIYETADAFVSAKQRHDRNLRARVTYGAPLDTLFGFADIRLPEQFGDLTLTGTLEAFRALSNIDNYSYDNFKAQMLLTKRLEF